ncbi:L-threonylcarbamoyladenylate synthase [Pararhodobacter sp. SW119]|uniref:L-threonylcarbamoyladenylate synthase n=1 Tax=Pararhodobacter sp. SW119 TaxID=2780075 RepID=UPI001ADFA19D|nr:L-threonylcarbamoyladenylate synthase [Pararhodobacter sp. SW119]
MPASTQILQPDAEGIARAAALLRAGALVAIPTETVYGLAGDAANDHAVAAIFAAKDRPRFNPLIVHLADMAQVTEIARLSPLARALAAAFWPGPLTLVLRLKPGARVAPLVTAGLDTVALRLPAHPVARAVLAAVGGGLAAPSANPSGRISPVSAAHVLAGLEGRIAGVVDGGDCAVGVESTILDATGAVPILLREGGLPVERIEEVLGLKVAARQDGALLSAPGQLASHYAPRGAVRLEVARPEKDEVWLGFGKILSGSEGLNLSPSGDLTEAAARLFHLLHEADARAGAGGRIAVAPVPEVGLGRAINDRLGRAAAPREGPK